MALAAGATGAFGGPSTSRPWSGQSRNGSRITIGRKHESRTPHYCDARLTNYAGLVLRAQGASLDAGLNLQPAQTYFGGGIGIEGPALTPLLTLRPRAIVWLC
jgi:hypothetical protein